MTTSGGATWMPWCLAARRSNAGCLVPIGLVRSLAWPCDHAMGVERGKGRDMVKFSKKQQTNILLDVMSTIKFSKNKVFSSKSYYF